MGPQAVSRRPLNNEPSTAENDQRSDKAIRKILELAVKENPLPGLIAAIAKPGSTVQKPILRMAAVGVRKFGNEVDLTLDDQIHLGSCTKAITASMIARLVEQEKLAWSMTLKDGLPELCKEIHPDYHGVTLSQLLMHKAGMPRNAANWSLADGSDLTETRRLIAVDSLAKAPPGKPGQDFEYSNLGYLIAGLMAAKETGKSWEELIQKEVFDELKLSSAGFGPPGTLGELDQPWGHIPLGDGRFGPFQRDNPPALGPAGTIHMSIGDWAIFVLEHTRTEGGDFLSKASLAELQLPDPKSAYAKGWLVTRRGWGKGKVLFHNGSNTFWYATVWVAPKTGSAYFVVTNTASVDSNKVIDELVGKLIELDLSGK